MAKPRTTRTFGSLHFEDLEPHRFESLVRNLLYDFRDWLNIEPTGQSGNDDGFDIRAWEKVDEVNNISESEELEEDKQEGSLPLNSNLWKIQCKREKELGPARVEKIISETVTSKESLYGYILAAPATFSKQSYDIFREKLIEKGVKEFYIWGRSELEDMLYMPKNDRILFSFFGFSLTTHKRSKTSEIKFLLNNKNKLFRVLKGQEQNNLREPILIRDFNDTFYPNKDKYKDFDKKPRWKEYEAFSYHPLGLWVHINKRFAYIDKNKEEFDFDKTIDLLHRESEIGYDRDPEKDNLRELAENYWQHLPLNNQTYFEVDGLILYEDMLVIDDKGDVLFKFPHIFIDYKLNEGFPFKYYRYHLGKQDEETIDPTEEYKKTNIFPNKHKKQVLNHIYRDKCLDWDEETIRSFSNSYPPTGRLFDIEDKYKYLENSDVICVNKPIKAYEGDTKDKFYLEITNKYTTTVKEFLEMNGSHFKQIIEKQVGQTVKENQQLTIYEFIEIYDWKIDRLSKQTNKS